MLFNYLHFILRPKLVRFAGFYRHHVFSCIGAFSYAEHFFVTVFTQVAHLISNFLPRVPDNGRMAAAFDDDYIPFQGLVFYDAIANGVEVDPVDLFFYGNRAMLDFACKVVGFVEVIGIVPDHAASSG